MSGLLNASSLMMCPHGGTVQVVTTNTRTKAGGDFVLRQSDIFTIVGCPFVIGIVPHPCVLVQWVQPAERSQAMGDYTLTEESVGLCLAADQATQGMVLITFTQPQAAGL
jgi:hypothetical protein